MVTAPVSCRAAMNRIPLAVIALARWKLPLPTKPKKSRPPSWAMAVPIASATRIEASALDECEHARWASRSAHDGERPRDDDRARRWEPDQVGQLGQPVLARAKQECVTGKRGLEAVRLAGVGADRLHADPEHGRFVRQPARAFDRDPRRVRAHVVGVEKSLLVTGPRVPARSVQEPSPVGHGAVLTLPGLDVRDLEEIIGVSAHSRLLSITTAGAISCRAGTSETSLLSRPVTQWIGASKWVPTC